MRPGPRHHLTGCVGKGDEPAARAGRVCGPSRRALRDRTRFILCERSFSDARYPRYPRLPVLICSGFVGAPGHGLLTACGETHVSAEVGQFSRWGRGARPTRRVREEYRVYFDRNATKNGAKRSGSGGMHRRPNAAWVLPPAVSAWPLAPRHPAGVPQRAEPARRGEPAGLCSAGSVCFLIHNLLYYTSDLMSMK